MCCVCCVLRVLFFLTPEHSVLWPTPKNARTGSFGASSFCSKDHQSGASSLALLPCPGSSEGFSTHCCSLPRNSPVCTECPDQSGVHRQPGPVEEPRTVHHHFQTPGVETVLAVAASWQTLVAAHSNATHASPTLPLWRTLRDDGQRRPRDGHIGNGKQQEAKEDGGGARGEGEKAGNRNVSSHWDLENSSAWGALDNIGARSGSVRWRRNHRSSPTPLMLGAAVSTISSSGFGRFGLTPCAGRSDGGRSEAGRGGVRWPKSAWPTKIGPNVAKVSKVGRGQSRS